TLPSTRQAIRDTARELEYRFAPREEPVPTPIPAPAPAIPVTRSLIPAPGPGRDATRSAIFTPVAHRGNVGAEEHAGPWPSRGSKSEETHPMNPKESVLESTPMQALKARIHNGQLVLDQPLNLPEGHELEVHVNDDGM